MAYQMLCPKCGTSDYSINRDNRITAPGDESFGLIFRCRCGKQLYGKSVVDEYERQKALFDAGEPITFEMKLPEPEPEPEPDAEELRKQEQLKKAFAYRAAYEAKMAEKRAEEEAKQKAEEERRWRERLAAKGRVVPKVASIQRNSRKSPTINAKPKTGSGKPQTAKPKRASRPRTTPRPQSPKVEVAPTPAAVAAEPEVAAAPEAVKVAAKKKAVAAKPTRPPTTVAKPKRAAAPVKTGSGEICSWDPCENEARPNSKYCSRACSNKNARARHKQRKKTPKGTRA